MGFYWPLPWANDAKLSIDSVHRYDLVGWRLAARGNHSKNIKKPTRQFEIIGREIYNWSCYINVVQVVNSICESNLMRDEFRHG